MIKSLQTSALPAIKAPKVGITANIIGQDIAVENSSLDVSLSVAEAFGLRFFDEFGVVDCCVERLNERGLYPPKNPSSCSLSGFPIIINNKKIKKKKEYKQKLKRDPSFHAVTQLFHCVLMIELPICNTQTASHTIFLFRVL